jgi:hypothetical protein
MDDYESLSHSKWECKYHVVFIPKCIAGRRCMQSCDGILGKEALRTIDVLAVDDLQFLQGGSTQAEFCHTLNALIDAGAQVVLAADRAPSELENLEQHVRSRLASGLMVEIGALGEELRLDILTYRAAAAKLHYEFDIPQAVLAFIAKTVTDNGHHLAGAFNRLTAFVEAQGCNRVHPHPRVSGPKKRWRSKPVIEPQTNALNVKRRSRAGPRAGRASIARHRKWPRLCVALMPIHAWLNCGGHASPFMKVGRDKTGQWERSRNNGDATDAASRSA